MAHRLVTSSMMSHDYDVIQSSSHLETRNQINYLCGPFKHTLKENIMLKHERIRITTAGEESNRATTPRAKFGIFT